MILVVFLLRISEAYDLNPVVSSLIHSKRRMVLELVPPRLKKVWKEWDLRVMVLLSLLLQIVLIIMGNRRKYSHNLWTRIVVWCAYLGADAIATLALGVLSNNLADFYLENSGCIVDSKTELTAFWAPFLLLHLGGPDTITSFALEDNELWLRHFLQFVVQTGTTIYVLVMSWTSSPLSVMFVLMFCAGLIKYGERTLALKSATNETLRKKLVEPSHGEFSEQNFDMIRREKSDAGYFVGVDMSNIAKEFSKSPKTFKIQSSSISKKKLPQAAEKEQKAVMIGWSVKLPGLSKTQQKPFYSGTLLQKFPSIWIEMEMILRSSLLKLLQVLKLANGSLDTCSIS
ncbi:uncharacterized protein LOC123220150 [Mangifera indica]|uniref:uncharacterized protein LOC123220150 n=1 Tax=Mangifera indica TaxID=29780 RepID=UPI001CFB015C|nr:uncharacterized protein LOC123220150 [Mangifera indica]